MPSHSTLTKSYSPDVQNIIDSLKRRVTELTYENEDLSTEVARLSAMVPEILPSLPEGFERTAFTKRERAILECLHLSMGKPVTKQHLLGYMYREDHDEASIKIVDVYVCKIRHKLRALKAPYWIDTVWAEGYILVEVNPESLWGKGPGKPLKLANRISLEDARALREHGFGDEWSEYQAKTLLTLLDCPAGVTLQYLRDEINISYHPGPILCAIRAKLGKDWCLSNRKGHRGSPAIYRLVKRGSDADPS